MNDVSVLLWTQFWQVTLLAAVVFLLAKFFAKDRPHLAHALWILVLIKCITPPVFSSQLSPFSWMTAQIGAESVNEHAAEDLGDQSASPAELAAIARADSPTRPIKSMAEAPGIGLLGKKDIPVDSNQSHESETATVLAPEFTSEAELPATINTYQPVDWRWVLLVVWLCGAAACIFIQSVRLFRFVRQIHQTRALPCSDTESLVSELGQQLGLRRKIRTVLTHAQISPAVIGLFRPTVLLPVSLNQQPNTNLRPLIAHELIHIRRGDLWWALLQTLAGSLFWFHPLVRFAVTAITRESERSCDEETIASLNINPADYARSLLNILEQKQLHTVAALPGVRPMEITKNRLERVMKLGHGSHKRTPWWTWIVLACCCAIVLPGASLVIGQTADTPLADKADEGATHEETSDEERLTTVSYDVKKIIERMQKEHPDRDPQEIELRLLRRFRDFPINDPNVNLVPRKTTLHENKIITTRTREEHRQLKECLDRVSQHGFRQILLRAHMISIPKGVADTVVWTESKTARMFAKNGEVRRESVSDVANAKVNPQAAKILQAAKIPQGPTIDHVHVNIPSLLDSESEFFVHRLSKADVHSWPVFETVFDSAQIGKFLEKNSESVSRSPTLALFDGFGTVFSDGQMRVFVTDVVSHTSPKGIVAHQPVLSQLTCGETLAMTGKVVDGDQFELAGNLVLSKITGADLSGVDGEDESVSIQVPLLTVSKLDFECTIKKGQTLARRFTDPMDNENDFILLLTPCLDEQPELPQLSLFGAGQYHLALSSFEESCLEEQDWNCNGNQLSTLDELLDVHTALRIRIVPAGLLFHSRQHLEKLYKEHNVSASAKEVEAKVESCAEMAGLTATQWKRDIRKTRLVDTVELEKMIVRNLCFRKLPEKVQSDFLQEYQKEIFLVRCKDPNKNVAASEVRTFVQGDKLFLVHADITVDQRDDAITFEGDDLEIGQTAGEFAIEMWASGEGRSRLEFEGNAMSLKFENGAKIAGGYNMTANQFKYDGTQFELVGDVCFNMGPATFMSDAMQQNEERMLFQGNVRVKFEGSKNLNMTADKLSIDKEGTLTVDGVTIGLKIENFEF